MKMPLLLAAVLAAGFSGGWFMARRGGDETKPRRVLYYVDPMHPWYKSDKPGIAPDCNMKLVPVYEGDQPPAAEQAAADRKVLYYYDPQAPAYRDNNPGLNPETGNELVPMYAGGGSGFAPGSIQIPVEKQQLIGVKTGTVERTGGARELRAVGKVALDERNIHHVHTRTEGWIETVHADYVGRPVKLGELLFTVYSPELFASQREYLLALRARDTMRKSSRKEDLQHMESLVEAAKQRLSQWEITGEQIAELERSGQALREIPHYAPHDGIITMRNAFPHQMAKPDMELYTIVDYSHIWILADLYEYEANSVRPGMTASVSSAALQGRTLRAQVTFVQPEVDPETRTVKVRLELANPGLILKPEMFVDVTFRIAQPLRLTVPEAAVLDAGLTRRVFVDLGNGYFEPRVVETAERYGGRVVILSGLKEGERIVTSGNFLIDSESQLKSAMGAMGAPQ